MCRISRLIIFILVYAGIAISNLSAQTADLIAIEFLQAKGFESEKILTPDIFSHKENHQDLLVLESELHNCFVVLKPEMNDYVVVAYSLTNTFSPPDNIPSLAEALITGIKQAPKIKYRSRKTVPAFPVAPMLSTKWSQGDYFNQFCPEDLRTPNGRTWVGCVPVAIGQIVNYYGKLNNFILDESYHSRNYGQLTAHSNGYEWSVMLDEPLDYDIEVSRFLSDLGILFHVNYGVEGTSASTGMALKGLEELSYTDAYRVRRSEFTPEDWMELMYGNLSNYSPVFVAGGGHAFVCDGYDEEGFLHFNLGGAGYGDGYYSGAVIFGFATREAIVGITPEFEINPPEALVIENINGQSVLSWEEPTGSHPDQYRLYINKSDFIEIEQTSQVLDMLEPGSYKLKVSAVLGGIESPGIGPVYIKVEGSNVQITDEVLAKAIQQKLSIDTYNYPLTVNQADLADLKSISLTEPLTTPSLLSLFKSLQRLEINATGFSAEDFKLLENFPYLQSLTLSNVNNQELPDLGSFKKIVRLGLNESLIQNLQFLSSMPDLRALEIRNSSIDQSDLNIESEFIEHLTIRSSGLKNLDFLREMDALRSLDLTGNLLDHLTLPIVFSKMGDLVLDNNNLTDSDWLYHFPNIRMLSMKGNKLETLGLHTQLPMLRALELSNNNISEVWFSFDPPVLKSINLSNNDLKDFPAVLLYLSGLTDLNLGSNKITVLPKMASHTLKKLDLSNNNLTNLSDLSDFQRLNSLILEGNMISDLSQILLNDFYTQINHLNILNNPVSQESFESVYPLLTNEIENLICPSKYEPSAPCFLEPGFHTHINTSQVELSWHTDSDDPDQSFEVLLGQGDSLRIISTGLKEKKLYVPLIDGQVYHWQVKNIVGDSTYFSGINELSTLDGVEVPFVDDFEEYQASGDLTTKSRFWRISHGGGDTYMDATIENNFGTSGSQSVHINQSTDITLDLDHIEERVLWVSFNAFVAHNKSAHFLLANIDGLQLDVFLNKGIGEIYQNGALVKNFEYASDEWEEYEFVVMGKNNRVYFKKNREYIFNVRWEFRELLCHVDGLIFSPDRQKFSRTNMNFDYYIDDVSIRSTNSTSSKEILFAQNHEIVIFPNPAKDHIQINGLTSSKSNADFRLLNSLGQVVMEKRIPPLTSELDVNLSGLDAGFYFVCICYPGEAVISKKIVIAPSL